MNRGRLVLAAAVLAVLAIGLIVYEAPDPGPFADADCFHVAADGTARTCEGDPPPATPTVAVMAANWAWWGPAAAPVTLGLLALAWWRRFRRGGGSGASPAPPRS